MEISKGKIHTSLAASTELLHHAAHEIDSLASMKDVSLDISELLRTPVNEEDAAHMAQVLDTFCNLCKEAFAPKLTNIPRNISGDGALAHQHAHSDKNRERMLQAAIFSHLGEGMLVIDKEEKIFLINDRARTILGITSKEKLAGLKYSNRFHLQNRHGIPLEEGREPVCKTLKSGETTRMMLTDDVYCTRKDETVFPIMLTASPIIFNKKIQGVALTFEDITHEKKMDEIKSDFIYIASHQLRTPLTVSTLHTEMLLAGHCGELTKDQKEFITEIHFYNKKMAQLLTVFMTVSKIELGTFSMQERPTDLQLVMEDVLHELATQIKNKNIAVVKNYSEELSFVETDPEFIRIVFQNLLSNAIKYTHHEGTISIVLEKKKNAVAIKVSDTGCGIPQEEQSRVFTKLYRGSNTQNHRWESNGLGLYIVKAIVDKCSGSITFHSEVDKGTTFNINLPVKESGAMMK